jgi:GNAT superfamily N-acetyltransferase
MKKLLCILFLSNLSLLCSQPNHIYTKDTCHKTYYGEYLPTDRARKNCPECSLSRFEVYDNTTQRHIGLIAYDAKKCWISYLLVDEDYRKSGIGTELTHQALEDMRTNYNCQKVALNSSVGGKNFWEKLGAEPTDSLDTKQTGGYGYVFHNSSPSKQSQ